MDEMISDVENTHALIRYNVKRLRELKKKTQLDLALSIGHASSGFYGKAEIGIQNKQFNIEHLVRIAKTLDVNICEFFTPIEIQ